ncbi:MAG: hypothetical protein AAF293_14725 [Pseudomonadota bacterium]
MNISPATSALIGEYAETALPVQTTVARRKVFYVSGFDPLGPRRYRELYRKEGPTQAAISGYDLHVGGMPRAENGNYRWNARFRSEDLETNTEFEFLGWDDIVRHSFRPSLRYVYALMFKTLWIYLSSGAISSMWRLRSGPLVAGLVPAFLMIFYLLFGALIGTSAAMLSVAALQAPIWLAGLIGLGGFAISMWATRLFEEQMMIYFMVNDLGYSAQDAGAYPEALSQRLDEFAEQIAEALDGGDYDEVLIVGHSSGAQLAITALSRCIDRSASQPSTPLALMTLGQSIAMTSFLPKAEELRADLARIADNARIFWLDVTAPGDGACFALTDPAANCRAHGRPADALNPVVISAAFRQTMDPEQLRQYRWRLLRMHFQYLCAFANPSIFDYFETTAGPLALSTRFAGRDCSPSMKADPVAPVLHQG